MKIRGRYIVISIGIIAALLLAAAVTLKHRATALAASATPSPLQALQGVPAIEQLKHQGAYESLGAAMNAARYNAQSLPNSKAFQFANLAQGLEQQAKIIGPSGGPFDRIGASVAISGDTAVIGAPFDNITVADQGSVYVFTRSGDVWTQQTKIIAEAGQGNQFGHSVAIDGNTLIASAINDSTGQGVAYVFVRSGTTWTQQQKLTSIDALGSAVAISGDSVIVGAEGDHSAYVFTRTGTTWTQQQKLISNDGQLGAFGHSVALDGHTALIGAYASPSASTGAAYVFTRSGTVWSQQQKLTAPDGQEGDQFGFSVALSGDTAAIGAPSDDDGTDTNQGTAYVFVRNSAGAWSLQVRLNPPLVEAGDLFGVSIALYADFLAVGAAFDDISTALNRGSVYVFSREGTIWTQRDKLLAGDGVADDFFGESVAIGPGHLLAGSTAADIGGDENEGAVYAFKLTGRIGIDGSNGVLGGGTLGAGGDQIGAAVAISGDTAVIGAPGTDSGAIPPVLSQGAAYVFQRNGAGWTLQSTLTAPDRDSFDQFGDSVAINGDTIVVGAPRDEAGGTQRGSAYVFIRNGSVWSFQQKLIASNGRSDDHFGWSVGISGETIAVGAPDFDGVSNTTPDAGAAYVFTRSGIVWSQQAVESHELTGAKFGWAVALTGDALAVGSPGSDLNFLDQGAVWIYRRNGTAWQFQVSLFAADANTSDQLGVSVALSEDENTLVAGAVFADAPSSNQGAAYVFRRAGSGSATWNQEAKLTANDGAANDNFGEAVGISGETVIVGAALDDEAFLTDFGSAYVYERRGSNWVFVQKMQSLTSQSGTFFGGAVGISGGQMVIGAPGFDDGAQTDQGVAFIAGGLGCLSLTVSPATLPNGLVASPYNENFSATGDGAPSHNFVISGGSLPIGLILSSSGNLSGTPLVAGTFNFTVTATAPNLCSANRSYTVTIQPDCSTFIINPTSQNFSAAGGSGSVIVTANDGCSWAATPNANWITLGNFGGTGSGSVGFVVAANAGASRTGMIFVAGHTFTINQAAFSCTFLLSPASINVTALGGPGSVNVTTQAGCAWAAVSNATWIVITAGANGTGNGTFSYSIAVNSSASPRTGTVTAGGQTFTVNQDGATAMANGLQFYPLPRPVRLLETRAGQLGCFAPGTPILGGTSRTQVARGLCDGITIPAEARAITGNITTVNSGGGFLTLYPSSAQQPLAANSNYAPNEIVNNVFTVGLGNADGAFKIFVQNTTDVVVDVTGYYAPPPTSGAGGLYFHPLPKPIRLLETRAGFTGCNTPGAPIQGGLDTPQQARISCDGVTIPAAALAVVGNATTVEPQGEGYLTLFPANAARPLVASSNYGVNQVVNGPFTVGLSSVGEFKIFSLFTTHLVVDVLGYYSAEATDANGAGLLFNPLPKPVRLLETRTGQIGCFAPGVPVIGNTEFTQPARVTCNGETVPNSALAIVGNATVVNSNGGFLTLWPSNAPRPLVATSNFTAGQVFNRHFTVGLGTDGAFKIYSFLTTDLVIDVAGYFAP